MKAAAPKRTPIKSATPTDVNAYIAAAPREARAMLRELRAIIKSTAPGAEEVISYRMPMYKYQGPLVAFAAFKNHVGFYGMGTFFQDMFSDQLTAYETSKGTIRFPIGKPIPVALVKKLVRAKVKENERSRAARQRR
jgi:uncharacterized protein YdhG (YjbR/CyaY superfamily)